MTSLRMSRCLLLLFCATASAKTACQEGSRDETCGHESLVLIQRRADVVPGATPLVSGAPAEKESVEDETEMQQNVTFSLPASPGDLSALIEGAQGILVDSLTVKYAHSWGDMEAQMLTVRLWLILLGALFIGGFLATEGVRAAQPAADAVKDEGSDDVEALEESAAEATEPLAVSIDVNKFIPSRTKLLSDLIADASPNSDFLISVDSRKTLTYGRLKQFLSSDDADVSRFGVAGDDRIGALIGNGPEAAVAFFAFSSQLAYCPINPALSDDEMNFEMADLPCKACVVLSQYQHREVNCPKIIMTLDTEEAGLFKLHGAADCLPAVPRCPRFESSTALVLHTSGTTKKPKIVPLSHEGLTLGARCIRESLDLNSEDKCLNMLPLFHIGGIICNVLGTSTAAASVVCCPHYNGADGIRWLNDFKPSWYYAGPTFHIMMMNQEDKPVCDGTLKFARNATAALLPSVAARMKEVFGCAVIPTYGMSECNPVASHRVNHEVRLAGVGPSAGPKIRIDPETNEVQIQGRHVFKAYDVRDHMDSDPNIEAFKGGWFNTGDCGSLDPDGYLILTGRQKELIVRGGEKISPLEVEDVVTDPRIIQKAAFSVVHEELGECVGLAVQAPNVKNEELFALFTHIRDTCNLTEKWLPEVIVKVHDLPKGGTGKLLRIGLAKKLGIPACSASRPGIIAYSWDGNTLQTVQTGAGMVVDSLGFMKKASEVKEVEEKELCMAVYAILVFSVVVSHQVRQLHVNSNVGTWAAVGMLAMDADPVDCTKWTLVGIVACTAYLNPRGPVQWHRLAALFVVYLALVWPIHPWATRLHGFVAGESHHLEFAWVNQRYFVAVVIIANILFAAAQKLPRPDIQCIILWVSALFLAAANPKYHIFTNHLPKSIQFWVDMTPHHGWQAWGVWLATYFTVSYYGLDVVRRVKAHPWARKAYAQPVTSTVCAVLLVGALYWQMAQSWWVIEHAKSECAHGDDGRCRVLLDIDLGGKFNRHFSGMHQRIIWLLAESVSGFVFVGLLIFAARGARWLGYIGQFGFGIYCAHNLWYNKGGSFSIVVRGVTILPQLQHSLESVAWMGSAAQTLIVAFYGMCQMTFTGVPFFCGYVFLLRMIQKVPGPKAFIQFQQRAMQAMNVAKV